jgi:hypothetical protein
MTLKLTCRCGALQGSWSGEGPVCRLDCYCRDCRAFARWLATPKLLDAAGGVSVVSVAVSQVSIDKGREHLACLSLSDKGLARWYASCCRTPVGNTMRTPKLPFLGLSRAFVKASDASLLKAVGPVRWQAFGHRALGPVPALPTRSLPAMMGLVGGMALQRLRGASTAGDFFDEQGHTRLKPQVLSRDERAELARRDDLKA